MDQRLMGVDPSEEIYLKYRDDMLRYATSLVGPDHAADVVSTVVLRTVGGRGLANLDQPRAYLMRAVLNESRSVWRKRRPDMPTDQLGRHLPIETVETLDAIWQLPIRQRAAVYLFYWEDLTVAEVATLMDVSPGAVKRYLYLGRQKLKRSLR